MVFIGLHGYGKEMNFSGRLVKNYRILKVLEVNGSSGKTTLKNLNVSS